MIISFKNLNGGGGGGYVLPTATPTRLGGVKIGQGINVDSAGTISVSGSDVANYAMALKNINESDENSYKVINDNGWIYYVDDFKNTEENIFVRVKYDAEWVSIDMDIDGQTVTGIMGIMDIANIDFQFTISIDSEGNLFYINENLEKVYYDSEVDEYQYGDFTFTWESNGKHISFPQQTSLIEANVLTDNFEYWYCVGQQMYIANQDTLGLVKIGEGIDLAEDGTISVQGGGIEVVTELPLEGTDGQIVVLKNENTAYISISGTDVMDTATTVVYSGITERTPLFDYAYYDEYVNVYVESDETFTFYSQKYQDDWTIGDGDTFDVEGSGVETNVITVTKVADGEWIFENSLPIQRTNINSVSPTTSYKTYMWSYEDIPSVDINLGGCVQMSDDYFYSEVEFHFDEIPSFEGSAFTICQIGEAGFGSDHTRYIKYTSGGTFEWVGFGQTITLNADGNMHFAFDGRIDKYLISDGYIKIIGMPWDSSVSFITIDGSYVLGYDDLWNGEINKNGWVEFGRRGIQQKGQHNYGDFFFTANGQQIPYKQNGINIWQPPYPVGGNKILSTPSQEGMEWIDLATQFQLVDDLPPFADEGSFAIVNSGVSYTPSNAFLAANTTSPDGKNNFNDNTEISHIGNGSYIYFDCNGELTTSTAKTFLFRIAMRTNENGDWNTSNLAYINVYREYDSVSQEHFYSWDMPPFDYYDDQGNDFTYSDSGTVDSSTTANTTSYLPLWKWWDGTYGYKFYFEYDIVADTLKTYLYHSSIDPIQGENYGDVNWECRNHTKEFCEFDTDPNMSEVYVFKGGAWYKLGDLTQGGV